MEHSNLLNINTNANLLMNVDMQPFCKPYKILYTFLYIYKIYI